MKKLQKDPNQGINSQKFKWIIGIDEVGRGPLAGPVAVCACLMRFDDFRKNSRKIKNYFKSHVKGKKLVLTDSKKLTESQREQWLQIFKDVQKEFSFDLLFELSYASSTQIDQKGIAVCIRALLKKNVKKLQEKMNFSYSEVLILLDGSLFAPKEFIFQETIIKGDMKEPIISIASIFAKVNRDRLMKKVSKKFPSYLFDVHKGYGTVAHREAIKKYGACELHRKSFLGNILKTI